MGTLSPGREREVFEKESIFNFKCYIEKKVKKRLLQGGCKDSELCCDLVQEVFVRLLKSNNKSFSFKYVSYVANSVVNDWFRKINAKKRKAILVSLDEVFRE